MLDLTHIPVEEICLKEIFLDEEFNCRGYIAPIDVESLISSIMEMGLLNPILVEPTKIKNFNYRIVAGHRRFVAFKRMGKEKIPVRVVKGLSDLQARQINLVENIKRKDLNLLQEAKALVPFIDAGWNDQKIAEEFGVSTGWVYNRKCILDFDPQLQEVAAAGLLTQEQIKELHSMSSKEQHEAVRMIKDKRERNEKIPKLSKKERDPLKKKPLTREEIFALQEEIYDVIGACFATRCMARCAGEISDVELYRDLKDQADLMNIPYTIPKRILEAVE